MDPNSMGDFFRSFPSIYLLQLLIERWNGDHKEGIDDDIGVGRMGDWSREVKAAVSGSR